jgi:predicted ATP-grasp superfamily ATP-dependent carboligase
MKGEIATRYLEGISLSASFVVGETSFLPLTINRQLIEMDGNAFRYNGSQVPYRSPRSLEIWDVVEKAAAALGLKGYAGMDLIVGERPSVVDVNARPTTSLFGIAQVMKEEIADLIIKARFGGLPDKVRIEGEVTFLKEDLVC